VSYTFKRKQGVRFQDDPCFPGGKGRAVTADDFVYSLKRVVDPKLESQGDWIFINHVLGAQDWAKASNINAPLPGFQALDASTFQIRLAKPYPQLLWVLTMPYAFVIPHEAVEYYGGDFRSHPVGTGPYRLKSWRRNYRIEYERNPTFNGQNYPDNGESLDKEEGLLKDTGKPLPLLDRVVEYDVTEFYTAWQMFLDGQTFSSAINKD
jgi:ABC-type transport system substrate-binding protein